MKRQQATYLTKFLCRIQTLLCCQKHTAVGLTWQNHLLLALRCSCFRETGLGRSALCWKHTNHRCAAFLASPPFAAVCPFGCNCYQSVPCTRWHRQCGKNTIVQSKRMFAASFWNLPDFHWFRHTSCRGRNPQQRLTDTQLVNPWPLKSFLSEQVLYTDFPSKPKYKHHILYYYALIFQRSLTKLCYHHLSIKLSEAGFCIDNKTMLETLHSIAGCLFVIPPPLPVSVSCWCACCLGSKWLTWLGSLLPMEEACFEL